MSRAFQLWKPTRLTVFSSKSSQPQSESRARRNCFGRTVASGLGLGGGGTGTPFSWISLIASSSFAAAPRWRITTLPISAFSNGTCAASSAPTTTSKFCSAVSMSSASTSASYCFFSSMPRL